MEKEYIIKVDLKFTEYITADNKKEAVQIVKNTFFDEYGIELTNKEIISIQKNDTK